MKPTKDLFDLIHSLSPSEHKLFVQQAKRYGEDREHKKYQQLYDAIRQQEQYDEDALRAKLQKTISPKSFASWKRHLTEKLERVMLESHAGEDDHTRMHELLRHSELYLRRGMWSRSRKILGECKKLATAQEALALLLLINEQERRLAIEFKASSLQAEIAALSTEWSHLAQRLHAEQAYVLTFDRVAALMRTTFHPTDAQIEQEVLPLLDTPSFSDLAQPPTFRAKRMHHQGRAYLFHLSRQQQAEYDEYQRLIPFWEAHPAQQVSQARVYKITLANALHAAAKIERWEDFPAVLARMECIQPGNRNEEAEDFQTIGLMRLLFYYNTQQWELARQFFPVIEAGFKTYQGKVNPARWLSFKANMLLIDFLCEHPKNAKKHLEDILRMPKTDHRTDLQVLARIWEPILLFDQNDAERAASRLHALREWLRSKKLYMPFEHLVTTQLQTLTNTSLEELPSIFHDFSQALGQYKADHGYANGLDEMHIWATARANRLSMPEWIRRRKQEKQGSASAT
jgi:hypothetical protein